MSINVVNDLIILFMIENTQIHDLVRQCKQQYGSATFITPPSMSLFLPSTCPTTTTPLLPQGQFDVTVRLLKYPQTQQLQKGQLSCLFNHNQFISQIWFVQHRHRHYLLTMLDKTKTFAPSAPSQNIKNGSHFLQMMEETLLLVLQLHKIGVPLGEPLCKYTQLEATKGSTCLRHMIRYRPQAASLGMFGPSLGEALSRQQAKQLNKHFTRLLQQSHQKEHPVLAALRQLIDHGKQCLISRLVHLLKVVRRETKLYVLEAVFEHHKNGMDLVIRDKQTQTRSLYCLPQKVLCDNHSQPVIVRDLFVMLSDLQQPLKIMSPSKIAVLDQTSSFWNIVDLTRNAINNLNITHVSNISDLTATHIQHSVMALKVSFPSTVARGIGTMISPRLLITSAQPLFRRISQQQIQVASSSHIRIRGTKGEHRVKSWRAYHHEIGFFGPSSIGKDHSQSYHKANRQQTMQGDVPYQDYAMLLLQQPIELSRYFSLVQSYQSKGWLRMLTWQKDQNKPSLLSGAQEAQVKREPYVRHNVVTKKSDVGAPILITPKDSAQLYMVGIQSSQKQLGLKLTAQIIENLTNFELQMNNQVRPTAVQMLTFNYEQTIRTTIMRKQQIACWLEQQPANTALIKLCYYGLLNKYLNNTSIYPDQRPFLIKSKLLATNILLGSFTTQQTQVPKQLEIDAIVTEQRTDVLLPIRLPHASLHKMALPNIKPGPFVSCQCKGFYSIHRSKMHEFHMQVQFPSEAPLIQHIEQHVRWVHPGTPLLYLRPHIDAKQSIYQLDITFYSSLNTTILGAKLHHGEWLGLMLQAATFMRSLHQQHLEWCLPLEFCTLLNPLQNKVGFFYFGHWQALIVQATKANKQTIKELQQYYPVEEIMANKRNRTAFKKIDVWILGKSFERICSKMKDGSDMSDMERESVEGVQLLVKRMTGAADQRPTAGQVEQKLTWMVLNVRGCCQ